LADDDKASLFIPLTCLFFLILFYFFIYLSGLYTVWRFLGCFFAAFGAMALVPRSVSRFKIFDVEVDGYMVFSRYASKRLPNDLEIVHIITEMTRRQQQRRQGAPAAPQ
jgi:hypothetical protein